MLATMCHMPPQRHLNISSIGGRIAARRDDLRLDQEAVADRAGLSRAYISRLERGIVPNPKVVDLAAVADALDLSLDALIYGAFDATADDDLTARLTRNLGPELGLLLARVDQAAAAWEEERRTVLKVVVQSLLDRDKTPVPV